MELEQTVYVDVRRPYRQYQQGQEGLVEAKISHIGRKYVTVSSKELRGGEMKFHLSSLNEKVEGHSNYISRLILDKERYEAQQTHAAMLREIEHTFKSFNVHQLTMDQTQRIMKILNEGKK